MERRVAPRAPVNISLTCRMPAMPRRATVRDVSLSGCKLEVPGAPLELGGTTLLEVPGASQVAGSIVWAHGRVAGIQFERELGKPAAIALGLEKPEPVEPIPEIAAPAEKQGGLLRHWVRRLTGRLS